MDERSFTIITVAILIISPILLYMNSDETLEQESSIYDNGLVPVWERVNQNFNTTGSYSYTLVPCLLYTSPSPRDVEESRMPSSA